MDEWHGGEGLGSVSWVECFVLIALRNFEEERRERGCEKTLHPSPRFSIDFYASPGSYLRARGSLAKLFIGGRMAVSGDRAKEYMKSRERVVIRVYCLDYAKDRVNEEGAKRDILGLTVED